MKRKSPKSVAKTSKKQSSISGQGFIPPAYGINFVDQQSDSNDATVQRVFESSPEEIVSANPNDKNSRAIQTESRPNKTGLPDRLKTGIENLSGMSLDDVKVQYNSDKPAQLRAHAYTQGTDIHVASGQEKHLPHEAWHVVQQKQGRVKSTLQMKNGIHINDDKALEKEADVMSANALQMCRMDTSSQLLPGSINSGNNISSTAILQGVFSQAPDAGVQDSIHGGVKSQYDSHIEAGANTDGNMMQDFLMALWEAKDTITAGQSRVPGGVFMRPGGSQVLKLTMEMLGEAVGERVQLAAARNAKAVRKKANEPLWVDDSENTHNEIIDATVVPEHLAYRDALIGVRGIEMKPSGGGTSGATQDMLGNTAKAVSERELYDKALMALKPCMSISVTIDLATLNRIIAMMEGNIKRLKLLYLKALYIKNR
jgi:hypothetical protein